MFLKMLKRCFSSRSRLFISDNYSSYNDLRIIVFRGGSTRFGELLTSLFGSLSARITYPVRTSYKWAENGKVGASYRDVAIIQHVQFDDPEIIDRLISDHNVVINLIGGKNYQKSFDRHYNANVTMANRLA